MARTKSGLNRFWFSNLSNHSRWPVAKKSIAPKPPKVKFLFRPSEARKAELRRTYDWLINRARGRIKIKGVHDNHHIVPSCLGGSDDKSNIAVLTYDEHFLAHWILALITEGQNRYLMLNAIMRMVCLSDTHSNRIIPRWRYKLARQAVAEAYRAFNTGKPKPESYRRYMKNNLRLATITEEVALQIYIADGRHADIATKFGVTGGIVSQIKRRVRWKRIHPILGWDYEAEIPNRKRFPRPGVLKEALREKRGKPVENVTLGLVFRSQSDAQDYFVNIAQSNISACCRGKNLTAGGYVWRYITKEEYHERKNSQNPTLLPQKSEL